MAPAFGALCLQPSECSLVEFEKTSLHLSRGIDGEYSSEGSASAPGWMIGG